MTTTNEKARAEMEQLQERLLQIEHRSLQSGSHAEFERGMCVMEAVSFVAGEPWSDSPSCASPVIAAFLRTWNDSLGDEPRNRLLKPLIPLLVGTKASDDIEEKRSYMALDWLIRVFTPKWLDMVPSLHEHAKALRDLEGIADMAGAAAAGVRVKAARDAAWAAAWAAARDAAVAGDAAWAAAWAAARDAAVAGDAAWDAAGDAARDAAVAGDAARDAAWAAARDAAVAGDAARDAAMAAAWAAAWAAARDAAVAGDAAWAAAWAAARDAAVAGDAAWAAAWAAARDAAVAGDAVRDAAMAAAWAAAGDALKPTTEWLQASALDLVHRMIAA